jgi:phosphoglycolate phosphatase-like HAD superfamily hydrolase
MSKPLLYALDFDGVLCDSALETCITAWKTARSHLWPKMPEHIPAEVIEQFKYVRPALETGYESILIVRLLFEGLSADTLLSDFHHRIKGLIKRDRLDTEKLKQRFGATRDEWLKRDLAEWLKMNPLFPGVQTKLASINSDHCFIVTTKQERFVEQILSANKIPFPKEQIFGLDRKLSKQQVLRQLQDKYPGHPFVFLEDRLPTLISVMNDRDLTNIQLVLANWGYNTTKDKQQAAVHQIKQINLHQFQHL